MIAPGKLKISTQRSAGRGWSSLRSTRNLLWTHGDTAIEPGLIDVLVPAAVPPMELPARPAGPIDRAIADHVARLIPDHAIIELGLGAIPQAVTNALGRKQGLGVHFGGDRRRDRRSDGGRHRRQPAQGETHFDFFSLTLACARETKKLSTTNGTLAVLGSTDSNGPRAILPRHPCARSVQPGCVPPERELACFGPVAAWMRRWPSSSKRRAGFIPSCNAAPTSSWTPITAATSTATAHRPRPSSRASIAEGE
jgi:hypothetical protein